MAHTHTTVIHPSTSDLGSLFHRYKKGQITDLENFKYITIHPQYIVILQIEDSSKMDDLLNQGFIEFNNKENKYKLSAEYSEDYDKLLGVTVQGLNNMENWFNGFILFNEKHQLGLSVNMYKVYDNNEIISKRITCTQDFLSFLNETGICVY